MNRKEVINMYYIHCMIWDIYFYIEIDHFYIIHLHLHICSHQWNLDNYHKWMQDQVTIQVNMIHNCLSQKDCSSNNLVFVVNISHPLFLPKREKY